MSDIDRAKDVREGEELDIKAVSAYLQETVPEITQEVTVKQFPSGYSNLTYLLQSGENEYVLRRPPFGKKAKTAHDMGREYRMLSALCPVFPYCPRPLVYCEDESVIGAPFYVMERLEGIILRKDIPPGISFSPSEAWQLCENLVRVQYELHSVDYKSIGLAGFGNPEGYVRRQVEGWSRRYRDARTPDAKDFEAVMSWLYEKMPPDTDSPCIIHNDYKFDNVVLDPNDPLTIIGVLDWEMSTIGDPLMDLGSSLAYWVNHDDPDMLKMIRTLPTTEEGMMRRNDQVEYYAKLSGRTIDNFDFYLTFGLFRLAGIAQQIYYRYYHGQTKDERFKMLIHAVNILEGTAMNIIQNSKL